MAAGIYDSRNTSHNWPAPNGTTPNGIGASGAKFGTSSDPSLRQRYQPYDSSTSSTSIPRQGSGSSLGLSAPAYDTRGNSLTSSPPHNNVEMTREMLGTVLEYFSQLLPKYFDWNVVQGLAAATASAAKPPVIPPMVVPQPMPQGMRLVVHGGACMLLHPGLYNLSKQQQQSSPGLVSRTKTRDVDYIHRGFMAEYGPHIPDAAERLKECIQATAARFKLGADWMNSDADIALPMAKDPSDGRLYDPIYNASVNPQNIALHTIYRSSNGFLTLISVTPSWAVSLKLVRYTKWDAGDICLLLRNGTLLSQTQWTPETLEGWLYTECWAMNYGNFDSGKRAQMRQRIEHAIQTLAEWTHYVSSGSSPPSRRSSSGELAGAALPGVAGGQYLDAPYHPHQWGSSSQSQDTSVLSRSRPQSKGKNRASGGELTEAALAGLQYQDSPQYASQWDSSSQEVSGLSRSRPQSKGKSKSSGSSRNASRPASRAASRRNTPEQAEIFIPPDLEPEDEEDAVDRYAQHYDRDRGRSTAYANARAPAHERGAQGGWGAPPTGRSRVHTIHDPVASSHPLLANASTGGGPSDSPWGGQGQSQGQNRAADPYSMRVLEQAIGGAPPPGTVPEYPSGPNFAGVGAGYRPVIPGLTVPDPAQVQLQQQQQQQRRRAEKQRKLERQRARGSKWRPATSDTESDEDDLDSDDDDDKENRMRDRRRRHDPAPTKGTQGGAWHQLYAPAMGRSSSGGSQGATYAPERGPERGFAPFAQNQNPAGRTEGRTHGRSASRPPSRPSSRNEPSDNKRRPPPLDLETPFIPPGQGPEFADPARIAQWQFEQQRKNYQMEREQQQIIAEREAMYYQQRQFTQVPAAGQPPLPQMQMQIHYQQQQQLRQPQPQQQHPLYQHPQMYQQQVQMQMQQVPRGIYR